MEKKKYQTILFFIALSMKIYIYFHQELKETFTQMRCSRLWFGISMKWAEWLSSWHRNSCAIKTKEKTQPEKWRGACVCNKDLIDDVDIAFYLLKLCASRATLVDASAPFRLNELKHPCKRFEPQRRTSSRQMNIARDFYFGKLMTLWD